MAPLVIVRPEQTSGGVIIARRARVRDRLVARFRARRLDGELARGVVPQARASLALRAERLGSAKTRRSLALQLLSILSQARFGRSRSMCQIPIARREILYATEDLGHLVERLLAPGPVAAAGVAQVRLLLTDGSGPLYCRGAAAELRSLVARACTNLEPEFQW